MEARYIYLGGTYHWSTEDLVPDHIFFCKKSPPFVFQLDPEAFKTCNSTIIKLFNLCALLCVEEVRKCPELSLFTSTLLL